MKGRSCTTGFNEDRPVRLAVNADSVSSPTVAYASGPSVSLSGFDVLSGLWVEDGAAIQQTHDCGYDYAALLRAAPLEHYRWEATVFGDGDGDGDGESDRVRAVFLLRDGNW